MPTRRLPIHASLKLRLGYKAETSDREVRSDWKKRTTHVCKPCWELKYCPYGPLVEQSPLLPITRAEAIENHENLKLCLSTHSTGTLAPLTEETRRLYRDLVRKGRKDPRRVSFMARHFKFIASLHKQAEDQGIPFLELLAKSEDVPLEQASVAFPFSGEPRPEDVVLDAEDRRLIETELKRMETALRVGADDYRAPLTVAQRKAFRQKIRDFDPETYPPEIPQYVQDASCSIFGHVCPVFFVGEAVTESAVARRKTRYLSFKTKIRVVRRDNYTCQECGKHLQDDEVEFDHLIPVSRGGASEEHNVRLTCFDCNREKGASVRI